MSSRRDATDDDQHQLRAKSEAKEADILLRQVFYDREPEYKSSTPPQTASPKPPVPTVSLEVSTLSVRSAAATKPNEVRRHSLVVPPSASTQARHRRQRRKQTGSDGQSNAKPPDGDTIDTGSLSKASTTSEVNSDDDAASIASRLSQIVSEQEFMLMNSAMAREAAKGAQRLGQANTAASESAAQVAMSRSPRHRLQLSHHRSTGSLAVEIRSSSSGSKELQNCNADSNNNNSKLLHQAKSSVDVRQVGQDDQRPRAIFKMGGDDDDEAEDVHQQQHFQYTPATGRQPERGDLKALESARQRQLHQHSHPPGNKLDRGDGDLIVNICRSAWTLDEFEQAFKPEAEASNASAEDDSRAASTTSDISGGSGGGPVPLERQPSVGKNLLIRASKNAVLQSGNPASQSSGSLNIQSAPGGERRRSYSNQLKVLNQSAAPMGRQTRAMSITSSIASSIDSSRSRRPFAAISNLLRPSSSLLHHRKPQASMAPDDEFNDQDELEDNRCCSSALETVQQYVPIVEWLPNYKLAYFWGDLTSGSAVAVLNISLCLSAAVVAETDMGAAFRASIVDTFFYALLASSRHTSFGSWSIMSQMLLDSVRRALSDELVLNRINMGPSASWSAEEYEMWHMNIIIMYTFLIGLMQFIGGALSLGNILASFIPEALSSSMIAACAFTMAVGQLANMCGTSNKILWAIEKNTTELAWADLKNPPLSITDLFAGLFRWIQQIALLIKHHEQINVICVIISVVSVLLLTFNQTILQDSLRRLFKKKNLFVPFELILLISMIIVSYIFNLKAPPYNVTTCGPIFIDIAMPNLPNLRLVRELWFDAIATALISFTMVYIMSRTYSNKLNYEIDANQELIACGAGNLFGGLFDALPATGSFSRTASAVEAGAQTQMSSLVNCAVLFFLARLFGHHVAHLPVCVMSAALFFSFVRMMTRITDALLYWRLCKVDFVIWMVTFVAIITLDLVNGFVYSFIFSILTMLYRAQNRRCYMLGTIGTSDVYVPLAKYPLARELDGIKIFQFCGPVHYVSADLFERLLRQKTRVNVKQILQNRELEAAELAAAKAHGAKQKVATTTASAGITTTIRSSNLSNGHQVIEYNQQAAGVAGAFQQQAASLPSHILLDFSMISFIDSAGVHVLKKIITDYQRVNITVMCASLASHVATVVKSEPSLWGTFKDRFYVTLADAVHHAVRDQAEKLRRNKSTVSLQLDGSQSFDMK